MSPWGKRAVTLVACVLLGACGGDDGSDASDGSGTADSAGGPFEVVVTYPADGAADVRGSTTISIGFSAHVDPVWSGIDEHPAGKPVSQPKTVGTA